jgi:hypothetical protein
MTRVGHVTECAISVIDVRLQHKRKYGFLQYCCQERKLCILKSQGIECI